MNHVRLISAVGTPLHEDESLHAESFAQHLRMQWNAKISGVLVGGSMGLMQMLTDATWRQLVEVSAASCTQSDGELLVGVGDVGLSRTLERVDWTNRFDRIEGVVVLTPYLFSFTPDEMVDYFHRVADASAHPVYLYNVPALTHKPLDLSTIARTAEHKNIAGIKSSGEPQWTEQLIDALGDSLRIIVAQPTRLDKLIQQKVYEHLDGMFALAPRWAVAIATAAEQGDDASSSRYQKQLNDLLDLLISYSVYGSFGVILNAMGLDGRFAGAPLKQLAPQQAKSLLNEPLVQQLVKDHESTSLIGDMPAASPSSA